MRRLLKYWRAAAVLLAVLAILAVALWPETRAIDAVPVTRGRLQVTIDEEGETRVRDRFVVSAPVAGRVHRIELEAGDAVARGKTVLARIAPAQPTLLDPRAQAELTAAVEASRAAVGLARAERDRAVTAQSRSRASYTRQQELANAGAISRDDLEAAQTALRLADEAVRGADFSIARAEYDLQVARARLQQPGSGGRTIEIVSPIDGSVLKRLRESEAVVPAGEPLLEIGNLAQLEVVADLLSTDAVRVPDGAQVLIEQWGGGRALEGRVRRVEPSGFTKISALGVEEQRVNVRIDFADPEAAARALGDAYRVEVRIVISDQADVLKVPVGALFRKGEDWAVFAVNTGRVRTQVVELGQRNAIEAQVVKGLDQDQLIVVHPPDTLVDGSRVVRR
jgi:HlyD family secretion protein